MRDTIRISRRQVGMKVEVFSKRVYGHDDAGHSLGLAHPNSYGKRGVWQGEILRINLLKGKQVV